MSTTPLWVSVLISGVVPIVVSVSYYLTKKRIQEIHVMVNSNLTKALRRATEAEAQVEAYEQIDPVGANTRQQLSDEQTHTLPGEKV